MNQFLIVLKDRINETLFKHVYACAKIIFKKEMNDKDHIQAPVYLRGKGGVGGKSNIKKSKLLAKLWFLGWVVGTQDFIIILCFIICVLYLVL